MAGVTLGYVDKPGERGYLSAIDSNADRIVAQSKNGFNRVKNLSGGRYIIQDLRFGFFGVGPQFLPINNRLKVKFTKDSSRRFFTGSEWERDAKWVELTVIFI